MQANDKYLYTQGCAAYNGDRDARRKWFAYLAPLAVKAAVPYGVLPSLVLAKAALESGYGTDLYESEFYEPQYGIKMDRKAQKHNNLLGMNAFPDNLRYLDSLPCPAWASYIGVFNDYGPHFRGDEIKMYIEDWKHYKSIEDCFEDWSANIRWQAEAHKKPWGTTIESQLLAIESYTPEGAKAETPGMHFEWQDHILYLYHDYDLGAYDQEAYKMSVKMTTANLDANIKRAYEYAHAHCKYGPTDRHFPPMEDGLADCVGLALRALYTMGYNHAKHNINEIGGLCEKAGLVKSSDVNDVRKHHGIVLMCPKGDRNNVAHVYYSLGGKDGEISKYDLGSDRRIKSNQPFYGVPINEWPDKRDFLCIYFVPGEADFTAKELFKAKAKQDVILRERAGKGNRAICMIVKGEEVSVLGAVSTTLVNRWFFVKYKDRFGFVYSRPFAYKKYAIPKKKMTVDAPDGFLNCRTGPGVFYPLFKPKPSLRNGTTVRILNAITDASGILWYSAYRSGLFFFVSGAWLK